MKISECRIGVVVQLHDYGNALVTGYVGHILGLSMYNGQVAVDVKWACDGEISTMLPQNITLYEG
jgi:hypothetical protein